MTSARRPSPADEQAAKEAEASDAEAKTNAGGALLADTAQKATNEADNASAEAVEGDLAALLDDVKRERDEYLELAQRAKADFENFRKRAAQQAAAAESKAKASLARDLIPAIDNLERALEAIDHPAAPGREAEEAAGIGPLTDGVRLVHRELTEALARAGVESFDPTGEKFDPNSSEALSTQPGNGADPGTVLEVLTRGYRLDGQVLRPARVVVAA